MCAAPADDSAVQRYQRAFTAHIRDPRHQPRPAGVSAQRMRVYNELLYNNLESFLLACFPITRRILGKRRWARLVREFFASHRCQTPLFRQIPEEFVRFLEGRSAQPGEPVFLAYFAHYEWVELAVDTSPLEPDWERIDAHGDLMLGRPALNPAMRILQYPFAVHRISPRYRPTAPDADSTRIIVFRDAVDVVRFVVVNVVTARLLSLLAEGECSGEQACLRIARELQHPATATVVSGGRGILEDLHRQGAVLGVWKA